MKVSKKLVKLFQQARWDYLRERLRAEQEGWKIIFGKSKKKRRNNGHK